MDDIINKTPKYKIYSCHNCKKSNIKCISLSNTSYDVSLQCKHYICLKCYQDIYKEKNSNICYICCINETTYIIIYLNLAFGFFLIAYPKYIWYGLYIYLVWFIKYWIELFYY